MSVIALLANRTQWTHHNVDDEDSDVAKRRSTGSQVGERLVTGRVDDEQTRNLVVELAVPVEDLGLFLDGRDGEVGGSDLLSDTSRLTLLDVGLTDLESVNGMRVSARAV